MTGSTLGIRRALPYVGLLLVMAATTQAATGGGSSDGRPANPTPEQTEHLLERERERVERFEAHRRSPEARQERAQSRLAHRGLGRADALDLARSRFERAFSERLYPKLDVDGARVIAYEGDYTAHVERPDGERLLVHQEGPVPLRSTEGSGVKEPVDLTLEETSGGYEPRNPVVPISIAAGGAVTHPGSGVGFELVGASDVALEPAGEDRLFASNALPDIDVIVAPTALGARIAFQVRSADAPEQATLRFALPAGAELRHAREAGVDAGTEGLQMLEVVRHGEVIARLMPPAAWDAEGAPVGVAYELVGDEVIVRFPHRDKDLLYPLLVDPDLMYAYPSSYSWTGSAPWVTSAYPSTLWQFATNYALVVANKVGTHYGDYYGNWKRTFGSAWMIKTAAFSGVTNSGTHTMCAQAGVWLLAWDSVQTWCAAHSNASFTATVPNPQKDGGNYAIFQMVPNGPGYRSGHALASVAYATLYVRDVVDPRVTSGAPGSGWRDITSFPMTASGQDDHIGMNRFEIWSGGSRKATSTGCSRALSCTRSLTWSNVPEGTHATQLLAYDDHGNFATQNFTLRVDRSGPTLNLSGSLWDARNTTRGASSYTLQVSATDAGSGPKNVWIFLDGHDVTPNAAPATSRTWTFEPNARCIVTGQDVNTCGRYGSGRHEIRVIATDQLDNPTAQDFRFTWVPG